MTTFPPAPGFRSSKREHRIVIIDGPNMSNLGARNKRVYLLRHAAPHDECRFSGVKRK
jgi:hypothetical protein